MASELGRAVGLAALEHAFERFMRSAQYHLLSPWICHHQPRLFHQPHFYDMVLYYGEDKYIVEKRCPPATNASYRAIAGRFGTGWRNNLYTTIAVIVVVVDGDVVGCSWSWSVRVWLEAPQASQKHCRH